MDTSLPNQPVTQSQQDVHPGGAPSASLGTSMAAVQPATARGDDTAQPVSPVSTPHKEAGSLHLEGVMASPAQPDTFQVNTEELIVPSEPEPIIQEELAEHGVEATKDHEKPHVTAEHRKVGIEPAKESTPVLTQPTGTVQLPMTEEEALKTIKTTSTKDSKHWLARLIEKVYRQLRGGEK